MTEAEANAKSLYEGTATIVEVTFKELREYQTTAMSEEDAASGFNISLKCKADDESFGEIYVDDIEWSKRECTGKLAGKTQADVAEDQLKAHDLVDKSSSGLECVLSAADIAVGKKIPIYQTRSKPNANGNVYINTRISRGSGRLSPAEIRKRIEALRGGAKKNPLA